MRDRYEYIEDKTDSFLRRLAESRFTAVLVGVFAGAVLTLLAL